MDRETPNGIADTEAYRLDPSHPSGRGPGMSAKLRNRIRAAVKKAESLLNDAEEA